MAPTTMRSQTPSPGRDSRSSMEEKSLSNADISDSAVTSKRPSGEDDSSSSRPQAELEQNVSILSLCGIALSTGESWIVLGNSLTLAINNGGSPGVLYGFIADSICYWVVALSIAELASAMPSSGTVHRWATVAGGKYGHIWSWYAGWWNFAAWVVGAASFNSFLALQLLGAWAVAHPDYEAENWHVFCSYMAANFFILVPTLIGGKWLARLQSTGVFCTVAGWFISIMVLVSLPAAEGHIYQSSHKVWAEWTNETGWSSNGFVFCLGMLNAAYAVCAPDISAHLSEEIPRPERNIPLAILFQYIASFVTGFCYLITLFYSVTDVSTTGGLGIFPLAGLYLRATNRSAAIGLLSVAMIPTVIGGTGAFGVAGRQGWALARGKEMPLSDFFGRLSERDQSPFNATVLVAVITTALGCLYLGPSQAFNAFAGSFVLFTSLSYLAAMLPHLLSGRRNVKPGFFWMPGWLGWTVCALGCAYLITFTVIFCFPPFQPVTAGNMNYTSPIIVGWTLLVTIYWFVRPNKRSRGKEDDLKEFSSESK